MTFLLCEMNVALYSLEQKHYIRMSKIGYMSQMHCSSILFTDRNGINSQWISVDRNTIHISSIELNFN